jgi:hypothetical protein
MAFDIFSTAPANAAAAAQTAGLNSGYNLASGNINQAIGALNQNYGTAGQQLQTNYTSALSPYLQNYGQAQQGVTQLGNVLGLNGPQGSGQALQTLTNTPGYQFALQQGQGGVNAAAQAGGTGASGNQQLALQQQGQGLATQNYNNYVNQLQPYLGQSNAAASGINQTYQGLGQNLAANSQGLGQGLAGQYGNLANLGWQTQTGIGNANANADLSAYNASANILGALGGGLGGIAKLGVSGGGTLGGNFLSGLGFAEGGDPPVGMPALVGDQPGYAAKLARFLHEPRRAIAVGEYIAPARKGETFEEEARRLLLNPATPRPVDPAHDPRVDPFLQVMMKYLKQKDADDAYRDMSPAKSSGYASGGDPPVGRRALVGEGSQHHDQSQWFGSLFAKLQLDADLANVRERHMAPSDWDLVVFDEPAPRRRDPITLPAFADGGYPPVGEDALVGDGASPKPELFVPHDGSPPEWLGLNGPEVIVPQVPGTVIPNHALPPGSSPGAGSYVSGMSKFLPSGVDPIVSMPEQSSAYPVTPAPLRAVGEAGADAIMGAASLPSRFVNMAERFAKTGEYDPKPASDLIQMGLTRGAGPVGEGLGALGGRLTASERSLVSSVLADARHEMYDRGYHWEPGKTLSEQPAEIQEATSRFVDRAVQRVVHDRGDPLFSHDPETRADLEEALRRAVMEKIDPPKRAARASRPRTKQSSDLLPKVEPVASAPEKPNLLSVEQLLAALAGTGVAAGGAGYLLSRHGEGVNNRTQGQ